MSGSTLQIGKPAPAFTLPEQDGTERSLGEFAGKWLALYFYPKDNTPGCTTEACEFTAGIESFAGLDAVVLGCSPDSPASHRKFIGTHGLALTLLSDPTHAVMAAYGAWGEKVMYGKKTQGVIRSTVLIDPQGRVAYHWPKVTAAGHAEQVHAKLAELR
jgi:peroxiredoxin Q/BCP